VLHAYALVESRSQPGNFYAVHMSEDVISGKIEPIGIGGAPTHPYMATERMVNEIRRRRERHSWGKP
jgi:hypothetical protein